MRRLIQAINNQQEQLRQLILNHNYLCKRFEKAQEYFDDDSISLEDKLKQEDNIIRLMKELDESIQNIHNMGHVLTEEERIRGVMI